MRQHFEGGIQGHCRTLSSFATPFSDPPCTFHIQSLCTEIKCTYCWQGAPIERSQYSHRHEQMRRRRYANHWLIEWIQTTDLTHHHAFDLQHARAERIDDTSSDVHAQVRTPYQCPCIVQQDSTQVRLSSSLCRCFPVEESRLWQGQGRYMKHLDGWWWDGDDEKLNGVVQAN